MFLKYVIDICIFKNARENQKLICLDDEEISSNLEVV
jgi:hypothetical protein